MATKKQPSRERVLLVFGEKTFKVKVPAGATVTFGPFSPPTRQGYSNNLTGTLRIYEGSTKSNIIACFTNVESFRDITIEYMEQVAKEEGAVIWKSDEKGYSREEKVSRDKTWIAPEKQIKSGDSHF